MYYFFYLNLGGPHRLLEETIPNTQTTVLLKNLQPGTPYAVTVLGENEIGQGQPSDILKLVTGEEGYFKDPLPICCYNLIFS